MKHTHTRLPPSLAVAGVLLLAGITSQGARAADPAPAPAERAAIVGGALPGGAVISAAVSAQSVGLAPVAGGPVTVGLKPGHYQLSVRSLSVARQTQQASFGEKVQSGKIDGNMPHRISMNVTVARQTQAVDIDGKALDVEVGPDGVLTGKVAAR
jgi:hypothetical protein